MKTLKTFTAAMLVFALTACGAAPGGTAASSGQGDLTDDAVEIVLSDDGIRADGVPVGTDPKERVYIGNDIVYYEEGKDFTYGEGGKEDAHSAAAAAEHTVVHITRAGTYSVSGSLSKGQIAVDLGEEAKDDPDAVVTLILNGADVTCQVAPAVIFYNVYECGTTDEDAAVRDVDTSAAGANVVIADGTENTVSGSYVARIYKPDSVVLNGDGTQVEDAKKLHKYDGAFYSRMSMNVGGGAENSGVLTINAENEGLDSELHLTINGGIIRINSGNDGINTNEDGVSVTTVNGGTLTIRVNGETGEGDGIDSNGWLVINGGTVIAQACSFSADSGIDSDMGIHINGGTVIATGTMLDRIEDGGQNYAVFNFAGRQSGSKTVELKNAEGAAVLDFTPDNDYSVLIYSSPDLTAGEYTLWSGGTQMAGAKGSGMGMGMGRPGMQGMPGNWPDGGFPEGMEPPEGSRPIQRPEGMEPPQGGWSARRTEGEWPAQRPDGMELPNGEWPFEGQTPPQWNGGNRNDGEKGQREGGNWGGRPNGPWSPDAGNGGSARELSPIFELSDGGNVFQSVSAAE